VDSPSCRPFDLDLYNNHAVGGFDLAHELRTLSRDYSQNCYQIMSILPTQCSTYVRPSVNFTRTREACPFSNICGNVAPPGVVMDSRLVDVTKHSGSISSLETMSSLEGKTLVRSWKLKGDTLLTCGPMSLRGRKSDGKRFSRYTTENTWNGPLITPSSPV
jgi:hypothetical protein